MISKKWADVIVWGEPILNKFNVMNPSEDDYLALLISIQNSNIEVTKDDFNIAKSKIEEHYIVMDEPDQSDETITQISALYNHEMSSKGINDLVKNISDDIEIKSDGLDLSESTNLLLFTEINLVKEKRNLLLSILKSNKSLIIDIKSITFDSVIQKHNHIIRKLDWVNEFLFKIDSAKNFLIYADLKAYVINLSAQSIKKVYKEYGQNCGPLYRSNLRYHVINKKIDKDIEESIKNNSSEFWFKNNGIVIVCEDITVSDNLALIKNFSFVNGGQTSYQLGEIDFENDFYVLCKVILTNGMTQKERFKFIESVSMSTNSQKPIKPSDLITNRSDIQELASSFNKFNPSMNLQLKRGENIPQEFQDKSNRWRNFKLEELGQLGLSFFFLLPGSAKNKKPLIWLKKNQTILFNPEYISTYVELRKLWWITSKAREAKLSHWKKNDKDNKNKSYYATGQWYLFTIIIIAQLIRSDEIFKGFMRETDKYDDSRWYEKVVEYIRTTSLNRNMFLLKDISTVENNIDELLIEVNKLFLKKAFESSEYKRKGGQFSNFIKVDKPLHDIMKLMSDYVDDYSGFSEDVESLLRGIFQ